MRERGEQRLLALLQVLQVARDQAHARAFAQETQRAGQADALAAAGDENVLVLELEVHVGGPWKKVNLSAALPPRD
ncbi:hypothetical protein D3C72_2208090 [compost metagenome]